MRHAIQTLVRRNQVLQEEDATYRFAAPIFSAGWHVLIRMMYELVVQELPLNLSFSSNPLKLLFQVDGDREAKELGQVLRQLFQWR